MDNQHADLQDSTASRQMLVSSISQALPRSLTDEHRQQLEQFIPEYFRQVPTEELHEIGTEDLAGLALSHWQLARTEKPDTPRREVYNPTFDSHGWQSAHTVIQIAANDQPWLVSSMQTRMDQAGLAIHRIIHPILPVQRDSDGKWQNLNESQARESLIHIEIDARKNSELAEVTTLVDDVFLSLNSIRADSSAMQEHLASVADSLLDKEQASFVRWLDDKLFACFGYARLKHDDRFTQLHDALGILATPLESKQWSVTDLLPEGVDANTLKSAFAKNELVICKAGNLSPVMRNEACLLYTSPSPRDRTRSRMPSSA